MARSRAFLALDDGTVFIGEAFGALGETVGEVCFNTSMTGYQEILTDPSYAEQIITFTYPHIGNVGVNAVDAESERVHAAGAIVRAPREASNWRAEGELEDWLAAQGIVGICGIDTRALVRRLRSEGAKNGAIVSGPAASAERALALARAWPGLVGRDLVAKVSARAFESWNEGVWSLERGAFQTPDHRPYHVVALDFGCKREILRKLVARGARVTIAPAAATAEEILARKPDGIFLSNGPGDPAAVGYAVETIRLLLQAEIPIFGICMGHQLLAQALGCRTFKLKFGHRGGNHPVKDLESGRIEITSQNHGFAVDDARLPAGVEVTHVSLFDGTIEGIRARDWPAFSVQHHPEASPGPHDADHLFDRFVQRIAERA